MKAKQMIIALMAVFLLPLAGSVYAADNNTEFGIEDDLTVLGTEGTAIDPDVEIKGYAVFGTVEAPQNIPAAPGNIFANGYVEISSGLYVNASSTFTAGIYINDVSSFTAGPSSIYISGGADGKILKYDGATGALYWDDDKGGVSGGGTVDYLPIWGPDGATLKDSKISQAEVGTDTHVYVNADIHLSSSVYFGSGANISTFTENGGLRFYQGYDMSSGDDYDAATKKYVDDNISGAGPWQRIGAEVILDNIGDEVGVGIAAPLAKLHVSSNNPNAGDFIFVVSSGPLAANNIFTVKGDMSSNLLGTLTIAELLTAQNGLSVTGGDAAITNNLTVNGNTTLGDAADDWIVAKSSVTIDIAGGAVDDTSALTVKGTDSSGEYAAKFYSGADLAAWIKKK